MLGTVAACLVMLALGLPGVIALRRLNARLTALEEWAYGLPLGVVVGSLALLTLAIIFRGLSTALVVAVAFASLAGALWAWPWSILAARLGAAAARQRRLGFAATTTARRSPRHETVPAQGPLVAVLALFGPVSLCILGAFIVRWAILWGTALTYDGQGLWASQTYIWGDWALHLGDVTSFVYGDNFPPQNTRYVGTPLAYHYLTSITGAAFVKLGMLPTAALALHSFVFSILLLLGLYAFALRLTGDREAAGVSTGLFLLGGGLGWLIVAGEMNRSRDLLGTLAREPWNQGQQNDLGFNWPNLFFSLLEPQRGYLYGLPLILLALTLLLVGVETEERRIFAGAGLVAGTLPFAHTSTLVALALIAPFIALLFPTRLWTWLRNWAIFFGLWIATAVPQLYLQQGGQRGETGQIRWLVGWITQQSREPWLWFWAKNLGWFLPLLVVALASRELLPRGPRRLVWAFMPTFVICNLVAFRPWDWDNTKFFLYWFLATSILVGALLVQLWKAHRAPAIRLVLAGITATMILSGLLVNYQQLAGKDRNLMMSAEELRVAEEVRALTPPRAVFAVGLQHNHPVPMLAGRPVVMSYTGWLYAFGIEYGERERDLRAIYALAPNTPALLAKYNVDYVVIGPNEAQTFKPNVATFRSRYERIISTGSYEIFKVR